MVQIQNTKVSAPPALPEDLYSHMRDMHPKSHEFRQDLTVLNELARDTGYAALAHTDIYPPMELIPPEGFESAFLMPNGAEIPTSQFEGVIYSLATSEGIITADVQSLVTDSGMEIRYCDLRPFMTASVRNGGPTEKSQQDKLDRSVFRDLKFLAETGHPRRRVKGVRSASYTHSGNTLARAFWSVVKTENSDGVLTVARIADSDTIPGQKSLYRSVFDKELRKGV